MENKLKSFKNRYWLFSIIMYVLIVLPFIIICIVNQDEYFQTKDDSISFGIGCVVGFILILLAIGGKVKFLAKQSGLGWYMVITLLIWLFGAVLEDLELIITTSFIGFVIGTLVFGTLANKYKKLIEQYKQALINREVMYSTDKLIVDEKGKVKSK